jgi:pyrimidine operon attenuation protein / uracil phosphoribosyltransferase
MSRHLLLSKEGTDRTLTRLAYEIVERNRGSSTLVIVGIRRRGVRLAETIANIIAGIEDAAIAVHPLDTTPFRDDLEREPVVQAFSNAPQVHGRDVVLVDDVLFTGRTARAAIDAVISYGRPSSIQLAVLIDRGHREFPIQPDYVGRKVPTKHRERIVVELRDGVEVFLDDDA